MREKPSGPTRWRGVFVAAHRRPMLPVFWGIWGVISVIVGMGWSIAEKFYDVPCLCLDS